MDACFFVDVAGNGDRWGCWHRYQTHGSKGPPVSEIGAALGWSAFQHEISRVSLRSRSGVDRIFWCFDLRAPPCRPRVSSDPDSDRVLPNVPRRALLVRCCVRSGTRDSMCCPDLAFFRARTREAPITDRCSRFRSEPRSLKIEEKESGHPPALSSLAYKQGPDRHKGRPCRPPMLNSARRHRTSPRRGRRVEWSDQRPGIKRLRLRARRICRRCASDASYESVGNAGSVDVTTTDKSLRTDSV